MIQKKDKPSVGDIVLIFSTTRDTRNPPYAIACFDGYAYIITELGAAENEVIPVAWAKLSPPENNPITGEV